MKKLDYDNSFAYIALIVVLFGVFAAAENALASGTAGDQDRLAPRTQLADEQARQEAMAEEAAHAVSEAVELDLDIQLSNHTFIASTTRR